MSKLSEILVNRGQIQIQRQKNYKSVLNIILNLFLAARVFFFLLGGDSTAMVISRLFGRSHLCPFGSTSKTIPYYNFLKNNYYHYFGFL